MAGADLYERFAGALSLIAVDSDRGFVFDQPAEMMVLWDLVHAVRESVAATPEPWSARASALFDAAFLTHVLIEETGMVGRGELATITKDAVLDRFYCARAQLIDNMRLPDTGQAMPNHPGEVSQPGPRFEQVPTDTDPADAYPDDWSNPPAVDLADWQQWRADHDGN